MEITRAVRKLLRQYWFLNKTHRKCFIIDNIYILCGYYNSLTYIQKNVLTDRILKLGVKNFLTDDIRYFKRKHQHEKDINMPGERTIIIMS